MLCSLCKTLLSYREQWIAIHRWLPLNTKFWCAEYELFVQRRGLVTWYEPLDMILISALDKDRFNVGIHVAWNDAVYVDCHTDICDEGEEFYDGVDYSGYGCHQHYRSPPGQTIMTNLKAFIEEFVQIVEETEQRLAQIYAIMKDKMNKDMALLVCMKVGLVYRQGVYKNFKSW